MSWETLKGVVSSVITTNGANLITGQFLRDLLNNDIIPELGANLYKGLAVPATNPGTIEKELWYIAKTNGTYTHFSGLSIVDEVAIFKWTGSTWAKDVLFSYSSLAVLPLTIDITSSPYEYDVPEGMLLDQLAIQTDTDQNIVVEFVASSADIYDGPLDSAEVMVLVLNKKKKAGTMPIYFRDFTNPIKVKLYLK